jgi:hypothetical protein
MARAWATSASCTEAQGMRANFGSGRVAVASCFERLLPTQLHSSPDRQPTAVPAGIGLTFPLHSPRCAMPDDFVFVFVNIGSSRLEEIHGAQMSPTGPSTLLGPFPLKFADYPSQIARCRSPRNLNSKARSGSPNATITRHPSHFEGSDVQNPAPKRRK